MIHHHLEKPWPKTDRGCLPTVAGVALVAALATSYAARTAAAMFTHHRTRKGTR